MKSWNSSPNSPSEIGPKEIVARPLSEREVGWISDILRVNDEWQRADISRTEVVAEGPTDEGVSFVLRAPEPENSTTGPMRESVGNLWIQLNDGSSVNVQLSQVDGCLRELYVLFIDPKHPKRALPADWVEVSRKATNV